MSTSYCSDQKQQKGGTPVHITKVLETVANELAKESATFDDADSKATWELWVRAIGAFKEQPAHGQIEALVEFLTFEKKDFGSSGKEWLNRLIANVLSAAEESGMLLHIDHQ